MYFELNHFSASSAPSLWYWLPSPLAWNSIKTHSWPSCFDACLLTFCIFSSSTPYRISHHTSVPNPQNLPISLKYNTKFSSGSQLLFQLHSQRLFCLVSLLLPHGSSDPQQ